MTVSETKLRAFADELRKYWSFDDGQMHTHSWHDRENFIERKLSAALTAALSDQAGGWQDISTAPETEWGKTNRFQLWSKQLGVCVGEVGNLKGHLWANVGNYHGNAIEHWGVTHYRPLPAPPPSSTAGEG